MLPLFEFLSGAHDVFNISLPLLEYKHDFHKKFPNMEWPMEYAVTDFSYAILNAICSSWNSMKLIDYINCVYHTLSSNTPLTRATTKISTFIHICCCHLPKKYSKDVKEHFPNLNNHQHIILKVIFAGMFGILDMKTLETLCTHFSKILLSKYVDDKVKDALQELARFMLSEQLHCEQHEQNDQDDA